jgi:putative spermidine/putrescine transport system ATP-binding protein
MADRIVVMRDGHIEQVAAPDVLYREPATPFVAGFIGTMNLIEGNVAGGTFSKSGFSNALAIADGPATFAVRPEALGITPATNTGTAKIHRVTDYGTHGLVDLELIDGTRLKAMVSDARAWKAEQPVDLQPRAYAAYRDDAVVYRSNAAS